MYIRFVVGLESESSRMQTGIITEAWLRAEDCELEDYQINELHELVDWLNNNLPCPSFEDNNWGNGVCWFKDNAEKPIKIVWNIVNLLKQASVPIRMLRTEHPGVILYEDDYQVVAIEHKLHNRRRGIIHSTSL